MDRHPSSGQLTHWEFRNSLLTEQSWSSTHLASKLRVVKPQRGAIMPGRMSRRSFMTIAGAAMTTISQSARGNSAPEDLPLGEASESPANGRIVDIHLHFDEKNPNFIRDLAKVAERINLVACLLTPYPYRAQVADAAKQYPKHIVP